MRRNSDSPWNPAVSVDLTPEEYEEQVVEWLRRSDPGLTDFAVKHLHPVSGAGGEYTFDAVVEFTAFNGARFVVLVECKRHSRPVERAVILEIDAKLGDVEAQKAMVFSTAGFQKGALEYASVHGIACVTLVEGRFLYETKAAGDELNEPPPWVESPRFAGLFLTSEGSSISTSAVTNDRVDPIREWLFG